MSTLEELLAKQSPESQKRIAEKMDVLRVEVVLSKLREEFEMSQNQMAAAMGISQPTVAKMEKADNDPRLSTLKRYVAAMGGELRLDVKLPDGKHVAFNI
ncbi:helix-turn-helix domain-containing protein [Rouxiella sp. Mn2063]|uniref:helix-turn-helix domain-containing protein n=1 Tax=Rouxiella sp. Mn2063 TaxID=3395262 RepID=UPI003BEAE5EF